MIKHFIGIDPGKNGAIVWLEPAKDNNVTTYTFPRIGKELDYQGLSNLISLHCSENSHVVLEKVHAIFGSAAGATFSFGHICGFIEGILVSNKQAFTMVQPKAWQKEIWEGIPEIRKPAIKVEKGKRKGQMRKGSVDTKAMSLMAAKRLFPNVSLLATERCTTPHDGIADALLMAEYCRRRFK